jgi:hypothetical protein
MKNAKIKKVLAATLAASMVMASVITAGASGASDGSSESTTSSSSVESSVVKATKSAGEAISVGGITMKTTIGGTIAATSVQGVAVKTALADVKTALGLTGKQTPVITVYDTDLTLSKKAVATAKAAATALGGSYVTALNVELGAKESGKFVTLKNGSVAMAAGLPKNADTTKTYSVVCVRPGGNIFILQDQDTDPTTVTFEVKAGTGTYALIAQ